jgi:hypothetical protein
MNKRGNQEPWKALDANRGVPAMKADLRAELGLLNRNVDEMIRLFQCATDGGIWTGQDAGRHEARLEYLRVKLNADFEELLDLRECLSRSQERDGKASPALLPEL